MSDDRLISPAEAAQILGVSNETVRRWIRANKMPAVRTPGGGYRVRRSDLRTEPSFVGNDPPGLTPIPRTPRMCQLRVLSDQ